MKSSCKSTFISILLIFCLMLVGCSNTNDSSSDSPSEADIVLSKIKKYHLDITQFVFPNTDNKELTSATAYLMKNENDNSYSFAVRLTGEDKPLLKFYLAKIYADDGDTYQYVLFPYETSDRKNNTFLQSAVEDKEALSSSEHYVSGGLSAYKPNELESIFNMQKDASTKFTIYTNTNSNSVGSDKINSEDD